MLWLLAYPVAASLSPCAAVAVAPGCRGAVLCCRGCCAVLEVAYRRRETLLERGVHVEIRDHGPRFVACHNDRQWST